MPLVAQLWHWCWFASTAFCFVVLALVFVRQFYKDASIFTVFVWWMGIGSAALIYINYSPVYSGDQYHSAFLFVSAGKAALAFAVVYEVFRQVFKDYPALTELSARSFRWSTVILILIAFGLAWLAPPNGEGRLMATFYTLARTFDTVLCGLLLFLFMFSQSVGLSWRSRIFGVALGIAIMTSGTLAAFAIRSQLEPTVRTAMTDVLDLVSESTTLAGVLVWAVYLFATEHVPSGPIQRFPKHDLETWNQELQRLLHP